MASKNKRILVSFDVPENVRQASQSGWTGAAAAPPRVLEQVDASGRWVEGRPRPSDAVGFAVYSWTEPRPISPPPPSRLLEATVGRLARPLEIALTVTLALLAKPRMSQPGSH